jgi:hypothetical protein
LGTVRPNTTSDDDHPRPSPTAAPVPAIPLDEAAAAAAADADLGDEPPAAPEPPGPALPYEMPGRKLATAPYVLEGSTGRHFVFPLVLIVLGTLMLYAGLAREAAGSGQAFARAAAHRSVYVAVVVLLSLGVAAGCARVLDVTFGLLTPAVVKLAAIVVAPMGAAAGLGPWLAGSGGAGPGAEVLGLLCSLPLMWWLFFFLFRMELKEAVLCCALLTSVRMIAAIEFAYR